MNTNKVLALVLCFFLLTGAAGSAMAEDNALMDSLGEAVVNVVIDLIGQPGKTVEAADWMDLKLAALHGKQEIIITSDIVFGEEQGTIIFSRPVTLRSKRGEHFTIDGNGTQMFCVQGPDPAIALQGLTQIENLTLTGGIAMTESADAYQTGAGGALFVLGDVKLMNCTLLENSAVYGAAVCADGRIVLDHCTVNQNMTASAGAVYSLNGDIVVIAGEITRNLAQDFGGGLYAHYGNIKLTDATITGNVSENGGGVYAQYGNVDIDGATLLSGNSAGTSGGAMDVENGVLTMTDGTVENNTASYGAVYLGNGSGSFTGSIIRQNSAKYGGGVYAQTADVSLLAGVTLRGNKAEGSGGAVYADSGLTTVDGALMTGNSATYGGAVYADSGQVELKSGSLLENSAEYGGALYASSGVVTVSGGVLRDNKATTSGGAIYNNDGNVVLEKGRIRSNVAVFGGGVLTVNGDILINGGLVFANSAKSGGGLYTVAGTVEILGGRVTGNTATESGGGAYTETGTVTDALGAIFGNTPDDVVVP